MVLRVVVRDDNAPHQIRLVFQKPPDQRSIKLAVSCTCRRNDSPRGGRWGKMEPMAYIEPGDDPWPIYNDPDNHNHKYEEFRGETRAGAAEAEADREDAK